MNKEFLEKLGGFDETSHTEKNRKLFGDVNISTHVEKGQINRFYISFSKDAKEKILKGSNIERIKWTKLFGNDVIYFIPSNTGLLLSKNGRHYRVQKTIDSDMRVKINERLDGQYDLHYDQENDAYYIRVSERKIL